MGDAAMALRAELTGRLLGFAVSQAIHAAAALGIADLLAERPRTAEELAEAAHADPDALYRLLRLLAGHGIFVEGEGGRFANSPLSELLREVPGSLRALALQAGELSYPTMGETLQMVQTGEPAFEAVFGAVLEEHLARDPQARARFDGAVAAGKAALAELLATRAWSGTETVVDVGGGTGALLQVLLERRAGLRGVVFDLPEVAAEAARRLRAAGLAERCQILAGSFFRDVPTGGDVYVLSDVLHYWNDHHAGEILRVVRRAIPDHGHLLLAEDVVAPPNQPGGKLMDLLMLAVGGRERTERQWRVLLADGGFRLTGIQPGTGASILEATPGER
jgi:hypothetical protein